MKTKILNFIKREFVLVIASILAIISCFFVPIDKEYINYFDTNTLILLFCMLIIIAGLKKTNIFELISKKMVGLFHSRRSVIMALVFGTFFFDMIVANDMSLITFLPLTFLVLHSTNNDKYLAYTFILQTIAANMGGMITPYGNPQNLFLYSYFNIPTLEFFGILLIPSIAVAILLFICCLFIPNQKLELINKNEIKINKQHLIYYLILFLLTILSIFRLIPPLIIFIITLTVILFLDYTLFLKVDYPLILTFFVFFIFSGNIARITGIKNFLIDVTSKNTLLAGILSCQLISNVPTAILLSKFTNNYKALLTSVNIGSLGILISSLASLITLKEFTKHQPKNVFKYILLFTLINTIFLAITYLVVMLT